jgi:urea carboxylase-associated protein 2
MNATPTTDASPATATTTGARDHARAMAGTRVEAMPTVPPSAATDLRSGVDPADVLWDEVVAGGGYSWAVLPRGTRVRFVDTHGDACVALLLHRADHATERLNVADTVKVQWQAYLGAGSLLLSDMGRVLAAVVEDTSGRHDALCGTTTARANVARYGEGAPHTACPNGRDHLALALTKAGRSRREVAPNVNLFKGVTVEPDGALAFAGDPRPGTAVELRAEVPLLVSLADVPHPLDPRPTYTVSSVRVTAWRGEPAAPDDPVRTATPEAERAYLATEQEVAR